MARPGQAVLAMLAWSWLAVLATCLQLDKSWLQSGRLQDGLLLQVTVPTLYQCLHLCVGRSLCRSVSFHRPSSQCQLNVQSVGSGVSLTPQADWLSLDRQHFQHEDMAGPCLHHDCQNDEVCMTSDCKTPVCIRTGLPTALSAVDCGPLPRAPTGMTLSSSTGTRYLDTANYTCNRGTIWSDTGFLQCNESSQWQGDAGGCSYTYCYHPGRPSSYSGKVNVTENGDTCQKWSSQFPNLHRYIFNSYFKMDGSVQNARNYCRALNDPRPWCYKTNPTLTSSFEYCDVPQC